MGLDYVILTATELKIIKNIIRSGYLKDWILKYSYYNTVYHNVKSIM